MVSPTSEAMAATLLGAPPSNNFTPPPVNAPEPVTEPVRPLRMSSLVNGVVLAAAAGVVAVGVFPDLFARFPQLSTLVGR